jgi:selenocysteine lyase/cysteine desulfurase
MLTDSQISELRSHFPILRNTTYLYSNSQGALSDWVEEGMREYMHTWRTSPDPWSDWMEAYEGLRTAFAGFIGAERDEVAIVTSASAGINPVANGIGGFRWTTLPGP